MAVPWAAGWQGFFFREPPTGRARLPNKGAERNNSRSGSKFFCFLAATGVKPPQRPPNALSVIPPVAVLVCAVVTFTGRSDGQRFLDSRQFPSVTGVR